MKSGAFSLLRPDVRKSIPIKLIQIIKSILQHMVLPGTRGGYWMTITWCIFQKDRVLFSNFRKKSGSFQNKIAAGTCFFLFPGVWHRYRPDPASGWEESIGVGFKGYYPEHLMAQHFFDQQRPFVNVGLNIARNEDLQRLFHKLLDCVRDPQGPWLSPDYQRYYARNAGVGKQHFVKR